MTITRRNRAAFVLGGGILCCLMAALWAWLPMHVSYRLPPPGPPEDYAAAKASLEKLFAAAPSTLSPAGQPRAFLHDEPTAQVFVLLHGLTNAPQQFDQLGRLLYERGHNVVIPLTPGHGEADRMTDKLGSFSADAMLAAANDAVTIARGLGRRVTVVGLSVNGTTAAWIAQNRGDVDCAVLLAPFLAPKGFPAWAIRPVTRILGILPNFFLWWDSSKKDTAPQPPFTYPRFSTRSIGETMRLGQDVIHSARREPPACGSILIVTTESDDAANNGVTAGLAADWRRSRPDAVATFVFPESSHVQHDFIDPTQPGQQTGYVYPILIKMLETGKPADS